MTVFQEYYQQVVDRDEQIAAEKPLPEIKGTTPVSTMFGLAIGAGSILFSFFSKYNLILCLTGLLLSTWSYVKYDKKNLAKAGIICSIIATILSASLWAFQYFFGEAFRIYCFTQIMDWLRGLD